MANISAIKLPDGVTYNIKDDVSGYITGYTETDPVFTASAAYGISSSDITNWNGKQAALVSGTNIKTVQGNSLLGSGNVKITADSIETGGIQPTGVNDDVSSVLAYLLGELDNIPTNVSDLTNDAGYVTTDEKVKYTDANQLNSALPLLFGQHMVSTGGSWTETVYASSRLMWNDSGPTLYIYNSSGNKYASFRHDQLLLANATTNYLGALNTAALTARRDYTLPDKTGTIALTDDIPTVPTITLNGSSTTSPSFYAPTAAGTSGYVLKSNGSGAPAWTNIKTINNTSLLGSGNFGLVSSSDFGSDYNNVILAGNTSCTINCSGWTGEFGVNCVASVNAFIYDGVSGEVEGVIVDWETSGTNVVASIASAINNDIYVQVLLAQGSGL